MRVVKLKDVLRPSRTTGRFEGAPGERLISVRLNGRGAVARAIGEGKAPKPFTGRRASEGQFVVSRIWARKGAMALIPSELDGVVVTNEFPLFDIDSTLLDPRYLRQLITSPSFRSVIDSLSAGASGQNRVSETKLLEVEIPLPPLDEQKRITSVLEVAEGLRQRRREMVDHLDALAKAVFYEMFGSPLSSVDRWPRSKIGNLATIRTGNTPARGEGKNFGSEVEWIKSGNLGGRVATTAKEWLSIEGKARARLAPAGSILVTCIAGSSSSIGKSSLVDREVSFNQQINAILPSSRFNSLFLLEQLRIAPELVRSKSSGGMKGLVSKSAFHAIEVVSPPLDLQNEFATRVHHASGLLTDSDRELKVLDELFTALQSRAFRGEL